LAKRQGTEKNGRLSTWQTEMSVSCFIIILNTFYVHSSISTARTLTFHPNEANTLNQKHQHNIRHRKRKLTSNKLDHEFLITFQWQAKFLTSHHVRMHRVTFCIPNTLIKLSI